MRCNSVTLSLKNIEISQRSIFSNTWYVYLNIIKTYANRIVKELLINIQKPTSPEPGLFRRISSTIWEGLTVQNIGITVAVVASLYFGYKLLSWLVSSNEPILKGAMLQKDAASLSQEGSQLQDDTLTNVKAMVTVLQDLYKKIIPNITSVLQKQEDKINSMAHDNLDLNNAINMLNIMFTKMRGEIAKLRKFINKK